MQVTWWPTILMQRRLKREEKEDDVSSANPYFRWFNLKLCCNIASVVTQHARWWRYRPLTHWLLTHSPIYPLTHSLTSTVLELFLKDLAPKLLSFGSGSTEWSNTIECSWTSYSFLTCPTDLPCVQTFMPYCASSHHRKVRDTADLGRGNRLSGLCICTNTFLSNRTNRNALFHRHHIEIARSVFPLGMVLT